MSVEFLFGQTEDGLFLQGSYWKGKEKNTCIVCIHGMGGNIIENYFPHIIGKMCVEQNIGFIYGHNRGYSQINDIRTTDGKIKRIGSVYEIFEECIYDIDLWINEAIKLGYKNIILMGHSFGCNKSIYYLSQKSNKFVKGLVLASPPDIHDNLKVRLSYYKKVMEEAKKNINEGLTRKLIYSEDSEELISSASFVNKFNENALCDNLPIMRTPEKFEQFAKINIPILAFSGEKEQGTYKMLDIVKQKALNCPNFEYTYINHSGHSYRGAEEDVAKVIISFIKNNIF